MDDFESRLCVQNQKLYLYIIKTFYVSNESKIFLHNTTFSVWLPYIPLNVKNYKLIANKRIYYIQGLFIIYKVYLLYTRFIYYLFIIYYFFMIGNRQNLIRFWLLFRLFIFYHILIDMVIGTRLVFHNYPYLFWFWLIWSLGIVKWTVIASIWPKWWFWALLVFFTCKAKQKSWKKIFKFDGSF